MIKGVADVLLLCTHANTCFMGAALLKGGLQEQLVAAFPRSDPAQIRVFRAPGRVNIIGEHTDYNDGFVMPVAIGFDVRVACMKNHSGTLAIRSLQEAQTVAFNLHESAPQARHDWTDYVRGVQIQLARAGFKISGADLLIDGQVPIGAGLSSSAALEVATAIALLQVAGGTLDGIALAKLCQRAENEFVGAPCGIMDQFASANGRAGHAILLDCRSLEPRFVPLSADVALVICNTMVKHSIAGGEYRKRRFECEECVAYFQKHLPAVRSLRDISEQGFNRYGSGLPDVLHRRCRHVITENARVLAAAQAFEKRKFEEVGRLMNESHASLRDDYEVSSPELDLMVELARSIPGTYGSRMTGGGFGGCTINLVRQEAVAEFRKQVELGYENATGVRPQIFVTSAVEGAGPVG